MLQPIDFGEARSLDFSEHPKSNCQSYLLRLGEIDPLTGQAEPIMYKGPALAAQVISNLLPRFLMHLRQRGFLPLTAGVIFSDQPDRWIPTGRNFVLGKPLHPPSLIGEIVEAASC
jgi:hypothetical protein